MNNSCNSSSVTRSETWVHESCKEALEQLRLLQKQTFNTWVAFIKEERLKPCFDNLWFFFGKPEDTDDHKVLKAYSDEVHYWKWYYKKNAFESEEKRLMKILAATEAELPSGQLMQLSLEDSALIEKWLNRAKSRKENPDEYE